jgi:hypothetical protein
MTITFDGDGTHKANNGPEGKTANNCTHLNTKTDNSWNDGPQFRAIMSGPLTDIPDNCSDENFS